MTSASCGVLEEGSWLLIGNYIPRRLGNIRTATDTTYFVHNAILLENLLYSVTFGQYKNCHRYNLFRTQRHIVGEFVVALYV